MPTISSPFITMQTNATNSDDCQPADELARPEVELASQTQPRKRRPANVRVAIGTVLDQPTDAGTPVELIIDTGRYPAERPLFIPLKREFFNAFLSGTKREEFRRHGKQWNRETCRIGRRVTLSLGYGKQARLTGTITGFRLANAPADVPAGWVACYGPVRTMAACITIALDWFDASNGGHWVPDPHAITPQPAAPPKVKEG